jgi:two-component system cell cycle sensor histidine kinase/response regulator CckA
MQAPSWHFFPSRQSPEDAGASPEKPLHIVLVGDDAGAAGHILHELDRAGLNGVCIHLGASDDFKAQLDPLPDVILTDDRNPQFSASHVLRLLRGQALSVPVIVVTGTLDDEAAARCLAEGATDYLLLDRLHRLGQAVRSAVAERRLREEQRRTSDALTHSARQYHLIFEAAPHPTWIVDAHSLAFLAVNRAAIETYGFSREEFLTQTLLSLDAHGTTERGALPAESSALHRSASGALLEVDIASHSVTFDGKNALLCVIDDRTARNRQQSALQRSENLLQAIIDGVAASIFIKDLEGRFLLVNDRFAQQLGTTSEDLVGKTDLQAFSEAELQRSRENDHLVLTSRSFVEYEEETGEGHEVRRLHWHRFPLIDPSGRLYAIGGFAIDITAQRSLEAQLGLAQRMEAVGQLAGGIAHDFNNLLTAVLGYSQLLANQLGNRLDLVAYVDEIRKAGERATALTRQLLAFSRQQPLRRQLVDINALVSNIHSLINLLVGEEVSYSTALNSRTPSVMADGGQIEQVIMNIAVNARDAMPKGGSLRIETSDIELSSEQELPGHGNRAGHHVLLVIRDSGIGMDAATQARIFEPFFTTKEQHGTGLGLANVYGIVRQTGGRIEVASTLGQGTEFRIYLPGAEAQVAGGPTTAEAQKALPRGTETVLLVEDETALRTLVRTVLESAGYRVLEEGSPQAALALAGRFADPIQLILSDVVMPGMSGPEVARRLAVSHPETRVLFVSGYPETPGSARPPTPLGTSLLEKPFTAEGLLQRVRQVLDRTRLAS